ncbi:hypothetical protein PHMEG_00027074, partial [Phytophthora megakarya]
IRRWKSKKVDILEMASKVKTVRLKRCRQAGTAKKLIDDAEMDILEWITSLRSRGIPVSGKILQQEALEIASLYDVPRSDFAASPTWMGTFLSRYSLLTRAKTRQGQTTPTDSAQIAREFSATVRGCIVEEGIAKVYNADQTAVFFKYVPKRTIDSRGVNTIWVKCGGKSKERLTYMLLADSTGVKYDPCVVFKVKGAHWTPEVVAFAVEKNVVLQHIPPGYTHCRQPVDIAWNKPLKDRIRASWTTYLKAQCSKALVSSGDSSPKLTPPDRKRVLSYNG